MPGLNVDGVGPIGLPLSVAQAAQLRGASEVAPFGHGHETKVDETVRKARQTDASKVHLSAGWGAAVQQVAAKLVKKLGVEAAVEARLYKLVLYEEGGFFSPHKDTEKEPGMFATLVVQLPALHEGGALLVHHREETKTYDHSAESDARFFATAFYADCVHELREVTAGHRLCLIYNLIRVGQGPVPSLATADRTLGDLSAACDAWEQIYDGAGPKRLAKMLEHEYTETNISFDALKGNDAIMADLIRSSGKFDVHLALLEKHERGSAGVSSGWRRGWGDDDDDGAAGATMEDIIDQSTSTVRWIDTRGEDVEFEDIDEHDLIDDVTSTNDIFEDEDPARQEYEGYMGNYGPTLEYWYYKAVLHFNFDNQYEQHHANARTATSRGRPVVVITKVSHGMTEAEHKKNMRELDKLQILLPSAGAGEARAGGGSSAGEAGGGRAAQRQRRA
eukprot:g6524.t1